MDTLARTVAASLAVVGLMALAGCGGGNGDSNSATEVSTKAGEGSAGGSSRKRSTEVQLDPLHPVVLMETSLGDIKVRLDAEKAPGTVENFLLYVSGRKFDQTIFHQVLNDPGTNGPKVVIGGAYAPDGTEKECGGAILNEADNGLKNQRYTIAMARQSDVDSATRHFFFNLADNEILDFKSADLENFGYCVFGQVVDGQEVVEKIGASEVRDTDQFDHTPVKTVLLKTARRIR
jgi:peptidyl-prolyl cis-trans isomerase B (cyclophilin B)